MHGILVPTLPLALGVARCVAARRRGLLRCEHLIKPQPRSGDVPDSPGCRRSRNPGLGMRKKLLALKGRCAPSLRDSGN